LLASGARYLNIFPLMHSGNIYDHWRKATNEKRAFILTRSAFAGQQRNATVEWSGDIFGTFPVFKRQIAAGLNFALSGMPYWTTDIAGYTSPFSDAPNNRSTGSFTRAGSSSAPSARSCTPTGIAPQTNSFPMARKRPR